MSSFFNNVTSIPENVIDYVNTLKDLAKVQVAEKSTNLISKVLTGVVLGTFALLTLLFLSVGVAMWLNAFFSNNYVGFYVISGFYALIGIILYFARKTLITDKIADLTINILIEDDEK